MTVRTRIAPSPTGYMHIGTLRTVMFDYFLARQAGGQFIVRIEDTDQARLVPDALERLLKTFEQVGIDYDEGPFLLSDGTISEKGKYGPYIQSKRLDIYQSYIDQLVRDDHAYACFCTRERLEEMRAAQTAAKQTPKYDRLCLKLSAEEVAQRISGGEPHVIRMKIPDGRVEFVDAIRGRIEFDLADVDDQVIRKSDGFASYHLAVVVDDHLMEISHVLRGEEWISSTPKQILLHRMFGWTMPVYAHVPLILNPDKTKLSKRKGDVSVESFLNKGYLPEALINFISTLGFNPSADREVYTLDELVKLFDLSRVHSAGAVMNLEKLDWMNAQYIRTKSDDELVALAKPFLQQAGKSVDDALLKKICQVEKERLVTLVDLVAKCDAYQAPPQPEPALLVWKKADAEDAKNQLKGIETFLTELPHVDFLDMALLESAVKRYIEENGLKNGNVLWPLRVALSGQAASAGPFELAWVLGREETLQRIRRARESL